VPRNEALIVNLEHAADLGIRRSLAASRVPAAALSYLDPRRACRTTSSPARDSRREELAA